mgnify:CR=1 FL=1
MQSVTNMLLWATGFVVLTYAFINFFWLEYLVKEINKNIRILQNEIDAISNRLKLIEDENDRRKRNRRTV